MKNQTNLVYADDIIDDLKKLDKTVAKKIIKKLDENASKENSISNAKPLSGEYQGYYRYRIGDYRAIFSIDRAGQMRMLMILKIGHRKHIY